MKKVAIVHDWLIVPGGAERIVKILCDIFPEADLFSIVYDPDNFGDFLEGKNVNTSFIQKLPWGRKKYQMYLPLMPIAVEQFDLRGYDLVISSSTSVAKGVITDAYTPHICYCNTPMRYAWDLYQEYIEFEKIKGIKRALIALLMNYIRIWDRLSADRVDYFIANSYNVAKRIEKHYKRHSKVIYPPVDTEFYRPGNIVEDFFLIVSRLVSYKKIDIAVEAFNKLGYPVIIVGDGPEMRNLKRKAAKNIEFKGRISDEEIKDLYTKCRAFIFPGKEDFGITPLEAMSCGRPVIAYKAGGVLETVVEGKTGLFFEKQSSESLERAVYKFLTLEKEFNYMEIRKHALQFSTARFKKELHDFILEKYNAFLK